ncbi:hypothetical protein FQN54_001912 [Arachnomyces sp. PD_36]|nr:hypothetical protein FQN54_001912 [Arachnomyces sp. PD_36]
MTDGNAPSSSLVETVAGFSAGIISTLAVHPLDIVKTRLQGMFTLPPPPIQPTASAAYNVDRQSSSRIGSSVRIIRNIARNEGGIPAFYRGLTPNIVGNSVSWGLYFFWYSNIKKTLQSIHGSEKGLGALDYFLGSGTAGLITAGLTNPIWVIKTRMLSTGARSPGAYTSIFTGASQIYRSEGLSGFYRGLVPSLFGVSHGALQFMAYEQLKRHSSQGTIPSFAATTYTNEGNPRGGSRDLSNMDFLLLSGISKMFAGCATYPYQVIRARLQTYDAATNYNGVTDVIRKIWYKEGWAGFYKGLGPNLLRVLPSTWVTFLVYENMKVYLPGMINGG